MVVTGTKEKVLLKNEDSAGKALFSTISKIICLTSLLVQHDKGLYARFLTLIYLRIEMVWLSVCLIQRDITTMKSQVIQLKQHTNRTSYHNNVITSNDKSQDRTTTNRL